ncbi:MAG TPA: acyl carrier protein, partial [Bacillota bacterium]|nr:acyl carrier protein [Bacillota bacterium]
MLPTQLQSTHQKLADMISEILEVDPQAIDEQTHFGEFGFESVTLSEFAARVNTEFQVNLNPAQLYEYNTVETLA